MTGKALLLITGCWLALAACSPEASAPPGTRELRGDVTVTSVDDIAALLGIARIDGSLIVRRSTIERLQLPDLLEVTGKLRIQKNPELLSVGLGSLTSVGSNERDASIVVENNEKLADLDLGALLAAPGGVAIRANPALARIDLTAIESAAGPGIEISDAFGVTKLVLGRLTSTTRLVLESCQRLVRLEIGSLERADAVWIVANPSLVEIALPLPLAGDDEPPPCRAGGADKLVSIRNNDALPNCEAHRLRDRLVERGFGGTAELCYNRPDTCPPIGCPEK